MRIVDGMMAFPGTLLALALMAVLGARFSNIIIALTVLYTPRIARIQHAAVVQIREQEYVLAATALGCPKARIMLRHILPNTIGPIIVQATFILAYAVIAEAGLSFIGVGLPATTASWGNILSSGRDYLLAAPWITLFPGGAIFILVLGLNLLGDGLRDILDPRMSRRR
jgi:peptide/nickel transport system permease protein